jgi:outer membrane protein TolC
MDYSIKKLPRQGKLLLAGFLFFTISLPVFAQQQSSDSLLQDATLENVIQYALRRQPAIQQALVNEQITENNIKSRLADWYPQVNFGYSFQHNFTLPTTVFQGNPVRIGVENVSAVQFTATQNLFNRDVLLASRTARDVRQLAKQNTSNSKIDVTVDVMKAFYDVLTTQQQIKATAEDTVRLARSLRDAFNQYKAGVADRTDYKRATIALNNSRAQLNANQEALRARLQYLKSLMGYPVTGDLAIKYDSLQMENDIALDTTTGIDYNRRIEFRLLSTQRRLQEADLQYNKWSFLPNVNANGAYNLNFQNNEFGKLYNTNFPNSFAALTLAWPIFQGGKRKYDIAASKWQLRSTDYGLEQLKNNINAEYAQAIAAYRSNLINYNAIKENLGLAQEVYDVIQLQYRSGIKTYLEVIIAETDLRTARINYFNALNQVLASKVDVQRSLGLINY